MTRRRQRVAVTAATLCLLVSGCTGPNAGPASASPATSTQSAAHRTDWTAGIVDQPRRERPTATLAEVRSDTMDGSDRVVFTFEEHIPGYHVEYIDRPVRECGSGRVREMAGDGWLEVRFYPARAHTAEGQPTIAARKRMPDLTVLSQLDLTCDFEGMVTWVLGVESPNRYRVHERTDPARLIIDVRH